MASVDFFSLNQQIRFALDALAKAAYVLQRCRAPVDAAFRTGQRAWPADPGGIALNTTRLAQVLFWRCPCCGGHFSAQTSDGLPRSARASHPRAGSEARNSWAVYIALYQQRLGSRNPLHTL